MERHAVYLEDGRKAEKIIQESTDGDAGEIKITTELWAEPKVNTKLTQRIVEYKKPVVHRREIETVDENGEVVQKTVESLAPEVKMELREHIQSASVVALGIKEEDCNCYVTQEEMQKTFTEGLMAVVKSLSNNSVDSLSTDKVSSLQAMIGEKVDNDKSDLMGTLLWTSAAILASAIVYFGLFM